jgi:hypothetical protein
MHQNTVPKNTVNGREGWRRAREKPTVRKTLIVARSAPRYVKALDLEEEKT